MTSSHIALAADGSGKEVDTNVLTYVYLTDSQVVRDALGVYHVDVLGDVGNHSTPYSFRFFSAGTHAGSTSGSFYIIP